MARQVSERERERERERPLTKIKSMKDSHPIIQLFCFIYPPELSLHGGSPKTD